MQSEDPRTPPQRIRITGLQEAQLPALVRIEQAVAAMLHEAGITPEQHQPRNDVAIGKLHRDHDVLVAEADHQVAGYLAWADQAPGVAYLPILMVSPDYQRFGVGTRLLRELGEAATKHGIGVVVTPCWKRAAGAMKFLGARGFQPLDGGELPEKLSQWKQSHAPEPGQGLWWAKSDGLGTIPGLPRPS